MATDIVMPNMGFDAQSSCLIEWLKQPGDSVKKGDLIAVIESDKANVELESVAAGVLLEQLVVAGAEVPVGAVIARIGAPGEKPTPAATPAAPAPTASTVAVEISPIARKLAADSNLDLSQVQGSGPRGRIMKEDVETALAAQRVTPAVAYPVEADGALLALPKVRKAARAAGIDLAAVPATGTNGVTTMADLQAYLARQAASAQPVPAQPAVAETPAKAAAARPTAPAVPTARAGATAVPLSRIRQIIGKRMVESKREAPHFYVTGEFDLEAALKRLQSLPEPRPGLNDLIQYLTVQTLQRVPELNATFEDETIYQYDAVNLAVAVARDEGLITPVLQGAQRFSLQGMAQEGKALIQRARANRLQPDDLQGGTFTISNLGIVRQVDQFVAIISPPQVAILAVGTVKQRPVVIDGGLHIRHTVHLTLSGDHRAVDGAHLGRFMASFQTELDNFSQGK
ncbi:MAG: 2-oxo acid dehydrogenase subunit E2 [Caldilineaceae bacterium]|nr:2-oxo acid dehydrogenase subunit E2 [Caldilineaceae bacterium]